MLYRVQVDTDTYLYMIQLVTDPFGPEPGTLLVRQLILVLKFAGDNDTTNWDFVC